MLSRPQHKTIKYFNAYKHQRLVRLETQTRKLWHLFYVLRNALWPCETSWVEKAAGVAGRGQDEEPEQSSSWDFQHFQWWFSHPFSLSGHCNCRCRIQEDILEEADSAVWRSFSLGVAREGAVQRCWKNTRGYLCTSYPSSLAQVLEGNSVPTQPLKNLLAPPWGQCWTLGAGREGGRWNEEVLGVGECCVSFHCTGEEYAGLGMKGN